MRNEHSHTPSCVDAAHAGLHGELPRATCALMVGAPTNDVGGVFKGAGEQLVDTAVGVKDTVLHPIDTAKGTASLVTKPFSAWPALWHGIADPISDDWKRGNQGEAIGRGLFGVLEAVVGTKGLTKLARVSKLPQGSKPTSTVAKAQRAIDRLDRTLTALPRSYAHRQEHALKHEAKHAAIFGVKMRPGPDGTGVMTPNRAELDAFRTALEAHVASPDTVAFKGTYKGEKVNLFLDPETRKIVWYHENGEFWGAKKLNQQVLERVVNTGVIAT